MEGLAIAPPQQRRPLTERHFARELTQVPTVPDPEEALRRLDEWTRRIYGGSSYLKLKSPFARLVVNIAAFHPGAQYLVERYGADVLKSRTVMEYLTGTRDISKPPPRSLRIAGKEIPSMEVLRAARMGGLSQWTEKATSLLKEAGLRGERAPRGGLFEALAAGVGFQRVTRQFHPYRFKLADGQEIRVLLPEPTPGAQQVAGAVGELFTTGVLTGGALAGATTLPALVGRGAVAGAVIGATRTAAQAAPPKEVAKGAVTEAAFFGAFPIVGRVLSLPARFQPVAQQVAKIVEKLPPRLVNMIAESATMAATEALVALGETKIEGRELDPTELAVRMAYAATLGGLLGALGRIEKVEDLAKAMRTAEQRYRQMLRATGVVADERIIQSFRESLKRDLTSGKIPQFMPELRRRVWTPAQVERAAKLAWAPPKAPPTPTPPRPTAEAPPRPRPPAEPTPAPEEQAVRQLEQLRAQRRAIEEQRERMSQRLTDPSLTPEQRANIAEAVRNLSEVAQRLDDEITRLTATITPRMAPELQRAQIEERINLIRARLESDVPLSPQERARLTEELRNLSDILARLEETPRPTPTPEPTPTPPAPDWLTYATAIAEDAFAKGRSVVSTRAVRQAARTAKVSEDALRDEAQSQLAARWNQPPERYHHWEGLVNELVGRASKEGVTEVTEAWVRRQLSDPALQSQYLPHKGWRAIISRNTKALAEAVQQRIKPEVPAPPAPPAPPEPAAPPAPPSVPAVTEQPAPPALPEVAPPVEAPPTLTVKPVASLQFGKSAEVMTPERQTVKVRYAVAELDDLIPSHTPNFEPDPRYPREWQPRRYERDEAEKMKVIRQAQSFRPEFLLVDIPSATDGAPIVTIDGRVVSGNSRVLTLHHLRQRGNYETYRAALENEASRFGIDPETVRKMNAPVLVRVIEAPTQDLERLAVSFNRPMTAALSPVADAVGRAKAVSDRTLAWVSDQLSEEVPTIRQLIDDPMRASELARLLVEDGVISERELPLYVQQGRWTEQGKQMLENLFLAKVIDDIDLLDGLPGDVKSKISASLPIILQTSGLGKWDLMPVVKEAADLYRRARNAGGVINYMSTESLFGTPKPQYSGAAQVLALAFERRGPRQLKNLFSQYLETAVANPEGQLTMLAKPKEPHEIFATLFADETRIVKAPITIPASQPRTTQPQVRVEVPPERQMAQEVPMPELMKKENRVSIPVEPQQPSVIAEGKTDLPSLEQALGREAKFAEVVGAGTKQVWLRWNEHSVRLPADIAPKGLKKGERIYFDAPFDAEKIRQGILEWRQLEVTTPEGPRKVWVLKVAGDHMEDGLNFGRRRGAAINPFAAIRQWLERDDYADDLMPPGLQVDIRHIKQQVNARLRVWLHFRSPQQVAMRAKSPALLEFFDQATETADNIQRRFIGWMHIAETALNGLTKEEAELLSFALQDPNVKASLRPDLRVRADALEALHQDIAQVLQAHGFRVRQGFDFTHILRGDEVVTIHYKDAQGNAQSLVIGTYETFEEARLAALNKIQNELIPQGATDFRVEVFYQKNLPPDAWWLFDRMPLQRLLQGIERLSRQDQLAMETYAAYMERILRDPDLINPQSPKFDAQLAQGAEELRRWLNGEIDSLPRTVIDELRNRLGLKPAPAPWWTGQRSLNLETYERDLRVVIPAYIKSVARAVHNRALRQLERDILGRYPDMDLQEMMFLRDYRDALTGGTYWLAKLDQVMRLVGIGKPQRMLAYLNSLASIKYLGLNPAKWLLNRTQPYIFTGPLVGYERVFAALPKTYAALSGKPVTIRGVQFTAEELARAARLDLQDFRWMAGMERYLPESFGKVTEFLMMPFTSAEPPNRLQSLIAGIDWGWEILEGMLRDPAKRQLLMDGKTFPMNSTEKRIYDRFRHKLPQWAARIEQGEPMTQVLKDASLDVGRWVVDTAQFRQDITDMPMFISKGGAAGRTLFQFMNFAVKQMEFLFSPTTPPLTRAKALAALAFGAGLFGLPFMDELDWVIERVTDGKVSLKRTMLIRAADPSNPERWLYKMLFMGAPSWVGIDWSQSLGAPLWQLTSRFGIVREAPQPMELALWQHWIRTSPGATWLYDTVAAALEYTKTPNDITLRRLIYAIAPVGVARALQAYFAHEEGTLRSTVKGRPVLNQVDAWVTVPLVLGFLPERVSVIRNLTQEIKREARERAEERQQLAGLIAGLTVKGWQQGLTAEESQQLDEWLMRFWELGGDQRQIDAHIARLQATDVQQLLTGVAKKDIDGSPIAQTMHQLLLRLRGE